MLGILVHGDNHFVVRGPMPSAETARALARLWTLIQIQIGGDPRSPSMCQPPLPHGHGSNCLPHSSAAPPDLHRWRISSHEFRENLEWAVIVPGDGETSPAVAELLEELSARGIALHRTN